MKSLRRVGAVALLVMVAATVSGAAREPRKALHMLKLLKMVDGAGSGLDADTVRGVAPLVLLDSTGQFVGTFKESASGLDNSVARVVRRIDGIPVTLSANLTGFINEYALLPGTAREAVVFYYGSADCSGTRLMPAGSGLYPPNVTVVGQVAYYPVNPTPHSTRSRSLLVSSANDCLYPEETFIAPDTCCAPSSLPDPTSLGEATAFDLNQLGLVPPFHLDVPF